MTNSGSSVESDEYIADSRSFDGINDSLESGDYTNASTTSAYGSAWVYKDDSDSPTWATIMKNWAISFGGQYHFGIQSTGEHISIYIRQSDETQVGPVEDTVPLAVTTWTYVGWSANGTYVNLYKNGVVIGTPLSYDGTLKSSFCNGEMMVGDKMDDFCVAFGAANWEGDIDEVHYYAGVVSIDWIDFEYCNQVETSICEPLTVSAEGEVITAVTHTINATEIQWIIDTDDVTLTEFFETHTIDVSEIQWIIDSDSVILNEGTEIHTINVSEIQWIIDTDDVTNDFAGVFTPSGKYIWFNCSLASNGTQGCIYAFFCPAGQFVNGFWENGTASCSVP